MHSPIFIKGGKTMSCNKCNQKSSLDIYNITSTPVATGANLTFTNKYIDTGVSINYVAGGTTINFVKAGLYRVTLTATGSATDAAGDIAIQAFRNGTVIPGANSAVTSSGIADIRNLTIDTLVLVNNSCECSGIGSNSIPLTFVNTGIPATYSKLKLVVVKEA